MTIKDGQPHRIDLVNDLTLVRFGQDRVKVIHADGAIVAVVLREDWVRVAEFFVDISND